MQRLFTLSLLKLGARHNAQVIDEDVRTIARKEKPTCCKQLRLEESS